MMKNMPREVATERADLPHAFDLDPDDPYRQHCIECSAFSSDPRHIAWEYMQRHDRETATNRSGLVRETGS